MRRQVSFRWDPITIRMGNGLPRIFSDVEDALSFLECEWPNRNSSYHRAKDACCHAIAGRISPNVCKLEFEIACIDAGLFPILPRPKKSPSEIAMNADR